MKVFLLLFARGLAADTGRWRSPYDVLLQRSTSDTALGHCSSSEGEPCEFRQDISLSLLQLQKEVMVWASESDLDCEQSDRVRVHVGQNQNPFRGAYLPIEVPNVDHCPTIVNKNNWADNLPGFGDHFKVATDKEEGTITVHRIDPNTEELANMGYFGLDLAFDCCMSAAPIVSTSAKQEAISCSGLKDGRDLKCKGDEVALGQVGQGNFELCEAACAEEAERLGALGCCYMNNKKDGVCNFVSEESGATLADADNPTRYGVLCTYGPNVDSAAVEEDGMVLLGPGSCIQHSAMDLIDENPSALLEKGSKAHAKGKVITLLQHLRGASDELSVDSCKAKCVDTSDCSYASFFEGPEPSSPTECKLYGGIPCGLAQSETDQDVVTYGRPRWFFRHEN